MMTIIKVLGILILTAFYSIWYLLGVPFDRDAVYFFPRLRAWSRLVLKICGIRLEIEGAENLALLNGEHCIYVCNHSSLFDIPAIIGGIQDNLRIMYKRELERIPLWGWALKISPFIAVDRANPRDGAASLEKSVQEIQKGASVIIFAEGTRSKDGKLGAFKRGAFTLAARAQKSLVPVTLVGSNLIMPARTFRINSGVIRVVIEKPVPPPETPSREAEKKLLETIRMAVAANLPEELR